MTALEKIDADAVSSGKTRKRVIRSTLWVTGTRGVGQGLSFITTIILARLLAKDDFGLMSMAMVYMALLDTFIDFGFLNAIIQAKTITSKQLSSCFWILMTGSVALWGASIVGAPYIAQILGEERVQVLIRFIAITLLFIPFQIMCKGILSRDLRLDLLSKLELCASILRSITSVFFAYYGAAVWSLIYGYVVEKVVLAIVLTVAANWRPHFEFDKEGLHPLVCFGANVSVGNLLWFFYYRADVFVIGRVLGPNALGVYTIASQFAMAIFQFISMTWHRVLYPLFSRYQQSSQLGEIFFKSSVYLAMASLPIFTGLAAVAPDLVTVSLDAQWQGVVFPMQVLSIVAAMQVMSNIIPQVFNAIGCPSINTRMNLYSAMIFSVAFYWASVWWGLNGILWIWLALYPLRYSTLLVITARKLHFRVIDYAKQHINTVAASAIMFMFVIYVQKILHDLNIGLRLVLCISLGAAIYIWIQSFLSRKVIIEFLSLAKNT